MLNLQFPLNIVIQRIQIDQRVNLAKQIANRNANRLLIISKLHHNLNKSLIFQFAPDLFFENTSINSIKELS